MKRGQRDGAEMPFYASSTNHKTSAEIISEARAQIHRSSAEGISGAMAGAPRTLGTQRPFTPRERQRTLFGKTGRPSRPPSAVNLKYLQFQTADSLMSSIPSTKNIQLSTISSSLDERTFKQFLNNIDEKPELDNPRKKRTDTNRRAKSLQSEYEADRYDSPPGSGSKLKLPSLNVLSKPLHQRKTTGNKSLFMLNSLSEEREESNNTSGSDTFSPLTSSKSSDSMFRKPFNGSKPASSEALEHFPSISPTISLEVFNKRRLFGDFKSKSEDPKVERNIKEEEGVIRSMVEVKSKEVSYGKVNANQKLDVENNDVNQASHLKLAVQIPSPDLVCQNDSRTTQTSTPLQESKASPSNSIKQIVNYLSNKDRYLSDEDVILNLNLLFEAMEKDRPFQEISGDEKAVILKTLYEYVDSSNERLLMAMARIILALRVTGSNLSGVCKLIFKVARNDKNDNLFMADNTLELFMVGLGRAEPLLDAECLVYGYGAMKFLGMSPALLDRMRPLGALPLMTLHLKMFNEARLDDSRSVGEQGCHALYQLTGALRNMAGGDSILGGSALVGNYGEPSPAGLSDFMASGATVELCRTIKLFAEDLDVVTNVSRTLSVLSADYECCMALCDQKGLLSSIVKLLEVYTDKSPLIVRLTYILGNMVACDDSTRLELYNESGAVDAILNILNVYLKRCWPGGDFDTADNIIIGSDLDGSSGSDEDVMVKSIRVLANMCMNGTVGLQLAGAGGGGGRALCWAVACLRRHAPPEGAPLATSVLAALNNLTYYHDEVQQDAMQIDLCEALCRLLSMEAGPCVTEAVRVLGNMSRSKVTRDFIVDTGTLMHITKLLENDDEDACLAAAGVLVNMAADPSTRQTWLQQAGARAATSALDAAAAKHAWPLARLLCQALWNAAPLPEEEVAVLAPLLLVILDEQQLFGNFMDLTNASPSVMGTGDVFSEALLASHMDWEEFAMVAVNLLEKIDPTIDDCLSEEDERL